MTDLRYNQQADFPGYAVELDLLMSASNDLVDGMSLQSAIIIALGTDARAADEDALPDPDATDRRGWWGDMDAEELWGGWPVGSKLWLLERAKITSKFASDGGTMARAENYTRDALDPFIRERIATGVSVQVSRTETQRIDVDVTIARGREKEIELRYSELWTELGIA